MKTNTNIRSGIDNLAKSVFKISLVVTGLAAYALPMMETPYGNLAIVQTFGTLNILVAAGWIFQSYFKPAGKKQPKKEQTKTEK